LRSTAYRRRDCFRERLGFARSQEAKRDALLTHREASSGSLSLLDNRSYISSSSSFSFSSSISETRRINPAVSSIDRGFLRPLALSAAAVRKRERRPGRRRVRFSERGRKRSACAHRHTGVATASESVSASLGSQEARRDALLTHWEGSSGSLSLLDNRS
jgi:hypothetical protein